MRIPSFRRGSATLVPVLVLVLAAGAVRADDPVPAEKTRPSAQFELPENVTARAGRAAFDDATKRLCFYDYVDLLADTARIQADTICYDEKAGTVEALGNVTFSFPGAVLSGSRALYRIGPQTGVLDDVVGYFEQEDAILRAKRVEKVGPKRLYVEHAVFTSCTQPTPYWSFRLRSGTFDIGEYAYLRWVGFFAGPAFVFGSPYLVWPIKTDRATGLLFPDFRNSTKLGTSIGIPFYWPFASNADLTFKVDAYTKVGVGLRTTLDWLPTWHGDAHGDLYWINDRVREKNRWRATWRHNQLVWNDWQLTANLEQVSDFDYFTDYETDLARAAAAQTKSQIDVTKTWSWYSVSLRGRRYEQYFVAGPLLSGKSASTAAPQIEWRGRSQQLGRTPLYLSFVSSVTGLGRDILGIPGDAVLGVRSEDRLVTVARERWGRIDAGPQLSMPVLKSSWADLTFTAGWRGTWYTARPDPDDDNRLLGRSVFRNLWNAGFSAAGPRFQRIFLTPDWRFSPKLKHVIEPYADFRWRPRTSLQRDAIPVFDEIDAIPSRESSVAYGVRQRFFVLRPPETGRPSGLATARETSFKGLEDEERERAKRERAEKAEPGATAGDLAVDPTRTPLEFASFDLEQRYSFLGGSSFGTPIVAPSTGTSLGLRRHSTVRARLRVNPTTDKVFDATASYDPDNQVFNETSVSARLRFERSGYLSGRWFRSRSSLPSVTGKSSFVRAEWGLMLPNRRLSLETAWDWDVAGSQMVHQSYTARWASQCCAFRVGYDKRTFVDNFRREFSLVVDLSGIGEILNLQRMLQ